MHLVNLMKLKFIFSKKNVSGHYNDENFNGIDVDDDLDDNDDKLYFVVLTFLFIDFLFKNIYFYSISASF